jgi:hypothetical protein
MTQLQVTATLSIAAMMFVQNSAGGAAQPAPVTPPTAEISNGQLRARLYLPDAQRGFYRSTRFDWSGVIASLEYKGHQFYGPWFTRTDPSVRDFIYKDADIIASAQSAMVGPAEEFSRPQGYAAAKPGGPFVKIGVGVLRKSDDSNYSAYNNYELLDAGTWTVSRKPDSLEFTQDLTDSSSGYGYVYRKTVRLTPGKPEMTIAHTLRNTGRLALQTNQYNHNFLVLDRTPTGPDFKIAVPFLIETARPPDPAVAEIRGKEIVYLKPLQGEERVSIGIQGFGAEAKDYDVRVENVKTGAGFRVTSDRPLANLSLWSIRSVISMEPFVDVSTEPGATTSWTYTYTYFAGPSGSSR